MLELLSECIANEMDTKIYVRALLFGLPNKRDLW